MQTNRAVSAQPAAVGPSTALPAAPVNGLQLQRLTQAIRGLTGEQLTWASGYLAGLAVGRPALAAAPVAAAGTARLTILYASQTGNARSVAEALGRQAAARQLAHRVVSVADFRPRDLAKEQFVLLVISTQGEGEPPEAALELHRVLFGQGAPKLTDLSYGVFGLGDSSYAQFCQAAKVFDTRLAELGARRVIDRVDADLDFRLVSEGWFPVVLERVEAELAAASPGVAAHRDAEVVPLRVAAPVRPDRDHPFRATVLDNRPITTRDAVAEVRHLALEIDPQAIDYAPGDSLGVWFRNAPALVGAVLAAAGLAEDAPVEIAGDTLALAEALTARLELTRLHPTVAAAWARLSGAAELAGLAQDREALRAWCRSRQVIDLITRYPARPQAADFAGLLQPLAPRLYSIASAPAETADEVHLTVSTLRYQCNGQDRLGGASGFLAERLAAGGDLECYVLENPGFHLPVDGSTPIILVGAGTGIAPFRAFLQQRAAVGDSGRNWLVFGNRHFQRDFLYQADWLRLRKAGVLHRFSPAFSRDTAQRVYVQDRLRAEGAELWRWLDAGARIYSIGGCGDVNRNVLCNPNPVVSALHAQVHDWARRISEHLLPRTRAYHEIWLDGEPVDGAESEPLYGETYLPRKFKTAVAVPPHNDVDVYTNDLGFIAIADGDRLSGFNCLAGGGMGTTHGDASTYPRLADTLGFVAPDQVPAVAEAVLTTQRDFGNRISRRHARLKYTIDRMGLDAFKAEVEQRAGQRFAPARPAVFTDQGDRYGWVQGVDGSSSKFGWPSPTACRPRG